MFIVNFAPTLSAPAPRNKETRLLAGDDKITT